MLPRQLDPPPLRTCRGRGGWRRGCTGCPTVTPPAITPSPAPPEDRAAKWACKTRSSFCFSSRLSCADTIRRGEQESIGTSTITSLALTPSHTVSASLPSLHVCVSALASIRDSDSSMVRESGCRACRSRRRTSAALALSAAACTAASAPCVGCKNSVYRYVT